MKDCETCGNEIADAAMLCKFCGSRQHHAPAPAPRNGLRTVNIEANRPSVAEGVSRLENELLRARHAGIRVVRIIHGWGSTGIGGRLRDACRTYLSRELKARRVKAVIPGDEYSRATHAGRELMRHCHELKAGERADIKNPGITFVEL